MPRSFTPVLTLTVYRFYFDERGCRIPERLFLTYPPARYRYYVKHEGLKMWVSFWIAPELPEIDDAG